MLPDISALNINGEFSKFPHTASAADVSIPDDVDDTRGDRYLEKLKEYAKSIPYAIEPHAKAIELLDFFLLRLTQSVEAQDFDIGFLQWDTMLT